MKDLAHFQQQVADINGYETVIQLCEVAPAHHIKLLLSKAAELYAEHCFLQGKQEGEANLEKLKLVFKLMKERRHEVAGLGAPMAVLVEIIEELEIRLNEEE